MDLASIGFKADTSGLLKAERGLDDLAKQGAKTDRAVSSSMASVSKGFAGVAAAIGGLVSTTAALSKLVSVTREFDVLNAGLITATGSAKEASVAFKAIEDFATTTPYSLAQATKAFTQLVNLGLTPSEKALTSYGNTAAAMGKDLSQMVEAVADATVGEFERLKEFGIKASSEGDRVSFTFRGMTTTVRKSADEIEGYLMGLGNNEFAGAMANRMNTLDGAISNLEDSWDGLFRTVSAAGTGGVIEASVRAATDAITGLSKAISSGQIGAYVDAAIGKFSGFGFAIESILEEVGKLFTNAGKFWYIDMAKSAELIVDAFVSLPENIKAFLQLATVEVAAYVDRLVIYGKMAANAINPLTAVYDPTADFAKTNDARAAMIQKIMDERQASIDTFKAQLDGADKVRAAYDDQAKSLDFGIDRLEKYGKTAESVGKIGKKAFDDMTAAMDEHFEGLEMLEEIDKNRIARLEEEIDASLEWEDKTSKGLSNVASVSEKAAERIENAFADAWLNAFDGFESVVDGMKNAFKRLLAEMAHMALTKPIMVSLGMGGMLPGGASAATGGGIAGGLSSLSGIGGIAGMLGGLGAGFTGSAALLGAGQVGTAFGLTGNLFAAGEIMTGIGAALPIIAAGAAIAGVVDKISGGGLFGTSYKTTAQDLSLALGGGDVSGSITTQESKKRALFGGTKRRTSTEAFDTSSIDAAFDDIQDALASAAKSIGITGADEVLKNFTASFNLSVKDKSQTEIDAAIQEWVAGTTSSMVSAVFGDMLGGLQVEGETLLDTLNRVAGNMAAVESITKSLGLNYGLTGKAAAEAATNIVNLAGGIDQLSALSTQYYQSFYSETERQLMLQQQLAEQFAAINTTMPSTREGFRALVESIDLTTEAGQAQFAALMQLVPGMDQYLQALEAQRSASEAAAEAAQKEAEAKAAALKQQGLDLQLRLYDALGQSSAALALRRQIELEATDETLRAMLLSIYAAEDAATAQRELAAAQEKAAESARNAAQDAFGKLSDAISAAITAQDDILQGRLDAINSERDAINGLIDSQNALTESLRNAAQNAFGKLEEAANKEVSASEAVLNQKLASINAEREALTSAASAVRDGYNEQISSAQKYADSIRGISDVLNDFLVTGSDAVNPFKRLTEILSEAKAGLLPNQSELSSVLSGVSSAGSSGFASAFEQSRAGAIAKNQASQLKSMVDQQVSQADAQVSAIQSQAAAAQAYYDQQLAKLDAAESAAKAQHDQTVAGINAQVEEAKKQLNALLGIDDRALTVEQAMVEFAKAMKDANSQTIVNYDAQLAALDEQEKLAVSQHEESVNALNAQLDEAKKRLNVLLGIDDRMLTIEQAMDEFNKAMLVAQGDQVTAIQRVESAIVAIGEQIIEIAKPEDRVWIPPTMPDRYTTDAPITKEVLDLLKELNAGMEATAKHTKTSADALELAQLESAEVAP